MQRRSSISRITHGAASSGFRCRRDCCLCWAACLSPSRRAGYSGAIARNARYAALLRSRSPEQAALELEEMEATAHAAATSTGERVRDSLLRRKYVIPFLLACVILACNTATGINSIIGYNTGILLQSGLSDLASHWGYVIFTVVNFLATTIGMVLVDRKGRKFLLVMGTCGVIVAMAGVGLLFRTTEKVERGLPRRRAGDGRAQPGTDVTLRPGRGRANCCAAAGDAGGAIDSHRASLAIIYSYGDFTAATNFVRSDDAAAAPIEITRASCVPANRIEALFKNPFANLEAAQTAPLKIEKALVAACPTPATAGWWRWGFTSSSRSTPWGRAWWCGWR